MRIAFITDWMVSPGGSDRMLLQLAKHFSDSEIFTSIYNRDKYPEKWRSNTQINESFIARFPFARTHHRHLNPLTPIAFESFDLRGFDVVISLSAGPAKGVIPQIYQKHLAIILTPPRSLWDRESNFRASKARSIYKKLSPPISTYLRVWDQSVIKRADRVVSISEYIAHKVKKRYGIDSEIIYPGIESDWFEDQKMRNLTLPNGFEDFFLVVSRLYDYKRIDLAINAAKKAGVKLIVVGQGPDLDYLKALSGNETYFLGWVPDEEVAELYQRADALIFPGVEDFGYVPVEAMAAGTPVLAYNEGGVTETVEEDVSGKFFSSEKELLDLIKDFKKKSYDSQKVKNRALQFTEKNFIDNIIVLLEDL